MNNKSNMFTEVVKDLKENAFEVFNWYHTNINKIYGYDVFTENPNEVSISLDINNLPHVIYNVDNFSCCCCHREEYNVEIYLRYFYDEDFKKKRLAKSEEEKNQKERRQYLIAQKEKIEKEKKKLLAKKAERKIYEELKIKYEK